MARSHFPENETLPETSNLHQAIEAVVSVEIEPPTPSIRRPEREVRHANARVHTLEAAMGCATAAIVDPEAELLATGRSSIRAHPTPQLSSRTTYVELQTPHWSIESQGAALAPQRSRLVGDEAISEHCPPYAARDTSTGIVNLHNSASTSNEAFAEPQAYKARNIPEDDEGHFLRPPGNSTSNTPLYRTDSVATAYIQPQIIQPTLFGLHTKTPATLPWPQVPYKTLRLWDSDVSWGLIEKSRGVFDFTTFDNVMMHADMESKEVIYTLGLTSNYATKRVIPSPYPLTMKPCPPDDLSDWKRYVKTVASRYKGRIHYYEIWNEANLLEFYSDDPGDRQTMATMAQIAWTEIKAIDPQAKILCPSTTNGDTAWIDDYFARGGGVVTDIVAYHFYEWPDKPELALPTLIALRKVMTRRGVLGRPIWCTEAGWLIHNEDTIIVAEMGNKVLDWKTASAFIARAYILSALNNISRYCYYGWNDPRQGLTEADGMKIKPPAVAYGTVYSWLVGNEIVSGSKDSDGNWTCKLKNPQGAFLWIAWNEDGMHQYPLPDKSINVMWDLQGNTTDLRGMASLFLDVSPVLLMQSPFILPPLSPLP